MVNRDTKNTIELGIICGVCVILVNFFLAHFEVLIWPALAVTFTFFAILILDSLSRFTTAPKRTFQLEPRPRDDELARLQATIERNFNKNEVQSTLAEKLRTVGFSVASARMNLSKERLRELILNNPEVVDAKLKDNVLVSFLSGKELSSIREFQDVLMRIERL